MNLFEKLKWNIIIGATFIALNFYWIFINIQLWYKYHFTSIEFYFKYPDWVLIINVILCLAGEVISLRIFRKEIKLLKGSMICIVLWLLCAVLNRVVMW